MEAKRKGSSRSMEAPAKKSVAPFSVPKGSRPLEKRIRGSDSPRRGNNRSIFGLDD